MDFTIIADFIQAVGYPIAMSLIMLWYMNNENKTHREQEDKMVEAINNNTVVLTQLMAKMGDLNV